MAAHTDSPCLRVRPNSKASSNSWLQLGVETYGGGLWHTWFDRPLGYAGKVMIKEKDGGIKETLVHQPEPLLVIPNLAIHLKTAEERKAFDVNAEKHLQPLLCSSTSCDETQTFELPHHDTFLEALGRAAECDPGNIRDIDICLMESHPGHTFGPSQEFVSVGRIDNVASSWAAIEALVDSQASILESCDIHVALLFDHEEVGSVSACGANSQTVETWFRRVLGGLDSQSELAYPAFIRRSFLISADGAHGLHPNYPDKHQTEHRVQVNQGIVLKYNANQRYATTIGSATFIRELAEKNGVPVQQFVVRNDSPCGSTIGPSMSANLGISTVDLGIPQWAMHSARESCGSHDLDSLYQLLKAYYASGMNPQ